MHGSRCLSRWSSRNCSQAGCPCPATVFIEAMPEAHQEVLVRDGDLPDIPLPLQEVFQNLPSNALTVRADQTEEQISHLYPTPFSQKAEEDASAARSR